MRENSNKDMRKDQSTFNKQSTSYNFPVFLFHKTLIWFNLVKKIDN